MKCACSTGLGSTLLAIAGVAALGFAGYNTIRTGCPLGSCRPDASVLLPASNPAVAEPASKCPLASDDVACCPERSADERKACCGDAHADPSCADKPECTDKPAETTTASN